MSDETFVFGHVLLHQEFGQRFIYAAFGQTTPQGFLPASDMLVPGWRIQMVLRRSDSFGLRRLRLKGPQCTIAADYFLHKGVCRDGLDAHIGVIEIDREIKHIGEQFVPVTVEANQNVLFNRMPFDALGKEVFVRGRPRKVVSVLVFPTHIAFGLQGGPERGIDFSPFAGKDSPIAPWRLDLGDHYETTHEGLSW